MSEVAESLLVRAAEDLKLNEAPADSLADRDCTSEASASGSGSRPSSSQKARSIGSSSTATNANSTKVYYHIDEEAIAYVTTVPVPPERLTLGDFKRVLNRSNFKYYFKAADPAVHGEVKCEIRDDDHILQKSPNGHFELFLLTIEGSSHSDGGSTTFSKSYKHAVPGPAPLSSFPGGRHRPRGYYNSYDPGSYRRNNFEDSTIYTESETRVYSDDDSHVSTSTDNVTSVSRQPHNYYRRRQHRRFRRQPSRASTLSSMTETSMALQVIHVRLNMDSVGFLGISIVGQSGPRGDNGIYVAHIMPGGAVALDGRIEVGDMILEVNDESFEKLTNDEAVQFLKDAVHQKGPIKLTVAKSFDSPRANFLIPTREPVRPIDTRAWVQHTNAMIGMPMNSIPEGAEDAPTPIPGQYPQPASFIRPQSSSTATSNGSGGQQPGPAGLPNVFYPVSERLSLQTDKKIVSRCMAMPNSGLEVRNRTWLKIPVPMSFLGSALVDWLIQYVDGINDRKEGRKYAGELLRERLISHVVNKSTFTEQCYYVFGEECADVLRLRNEDGTARLELMPSLPAQPPPPQNKLPGMGPSFNWTPARSIGDYASLPVSPYPGQPPFPNPQLSALSQPRHGDIHSQASGNSNDGSSSSDQRRKGAIPGPPMHLGLGLYGAQSVQPPPSQPPPHPPFEFSDAFKLDGSNSQLHGVLEGFTVNHL